MFVYNSRNDFNNNFLRFVVRDYKGNNRSDFNSNLSLLKMQSLNYSNDRDNLMKTYGVNAELYKQLNDALKDSAEMHKGETSDSSLKVAHFGYVVVWAFIVDSLSFVLCYCSRCCRCCVVVAVVSAAAGTTTAAEPEDLNGLWLKAPAALDENRTLAKKTATTVSLLLS